MAMSIAFTLNLVENFATRKLHVGKIEGLRTNLSDTPLSVKSNCGPGERHRSAGRPHLQVARIQRNLVHDLSCLARLDPGSGLGGSLELPRLIKRDPECGRPGMEIALEMVRESGKFPLLSLDNLSQQACQGRDSFHLNDMRSERPYRETLV